MKSISTIVDYFLLFVPVLAVGGTIWWHAWLFEQPIRLVLLGTSLLGWWLVSMRLFQKNAKTAAGFSGMLLVPLGLFMLFLGMFVWVRLELFDIAPPQTAGAIGWNVFLVWVGLIGVAVGLEFLRRGIEHFFSKAE
jgi:hypothetical protein